jgi:hypothetical protein
VAKIDAQGTGLLYCGYIGGIGIDYADDIAVDAAGNAYIMGHTSSNEQTFPVLVGPDLTYNGGQFDAFVAKVNARGSALLYCGYIGGASWDSGHGVAVDAAGNAYVTGWTGSTEQTFPVAVGPDLTFNGNVDAYVAKVNAAGTGLAYCGYIGGMGIDYGWHVAIDSAGSAYVTGETTSTELTFPTKVGPDLTYNGGTTDAFIAKVSPTGVTLVYCGYIGGSNDEFGSGITVDSQGQAHVTGTTLSSQVQGFPVVVGPDLTFNGGITDAFIAKVNAQGTGFVYCGYIGGAGEDDGSGIAVDASGNAYVAGTTGSNEQTFPVKTGPDLTYNGNYWDGFVAKVALLDDLTASGTPRPGGTITLNLQAIEVRGLPYQVGTSLGTGPIPIDQRRLDLSPDDLLVVSVSDLWPWIFQGYRGVIDSKGQAQASIHIPNVPALAGTWIHTAFVTLDPRAPSGIRSISKTESFTITN